MKHCLTNKDIEEQDSRVLMNSIILNEYSKHKSELTDAQKKKIELMNKSNERLKKAMDEKVERFREMLPSFLF